MHSPTPPSENSDTSPFLTHTIPDHLIRSRRLLRRPPTALRGVAARLLRRVSGRRMMLREPSVRVRETAAEQLDERQSDWAYSRPIIVLDVLWNLALVLIAVAVLGLSVNENPLVPLRLWVAGYALQCMLHVFCVFLESRRRREGEDLVAGSSSEGTDSEDDEQDHLHTEDGTRYNSQFFFNCFIHLFIAF